MNVLIVSGVPANVNDERIQALTQLRENLLRNEPSVLFTVVNELSIVQLFLLVEKFFFF